MSGARAVIVPYASECETARIIRECDGFLFTGGADVDPSRYGCEKLPECGTLEPRRDELEFFAIKEIIKTGKPILGICRGMQLINAALGGTLCQDIPSSIITSVPHRQTEEAFSPSHSACVVPDTPLFALIEKENITANSFHHQCVSTLAPTLAPMAYATDGIIEAVYSPSARYIRAYQWHPERLFATDADNRAIFSDFVAACRTRPTV